MAIRLTPILESPKDNSNPRIALALTFGILISISLALVISTSNIKLIGAICGVLLASIVSIFSRFLLWATLTGGLVLSGLALLYLPQFQFISWLVAGASWILVIHIAGEQFRIRNNAINTLYFPSLITLAVLFIIVSIVTSLLNHTSLSIITIGAKGYFQIWPLMFALAMLHWEEKTIKAIPKFALYIAALQLPFVAHEYLVLAHERLGLGSGIVSVDIVAGTFGADRFGGGANATLALFMLMVWAVVLAKWKYKLLSTAKLTIFSIAILTPLFLNESKISVIYLVIIFLILFRDEIVRRPHIFILGLSSIGLLIIGLLFSYVAVHVTEGKIIMASYISDSLDQNINGARIKMPTYLNRTSVYAYWFKEHGFSDLPHTFIGHGLGESRSAGGVIDLSNLANTKYKGVGIGSVSTSAILWDTGVIGFGLIMAMFIWAWRATGRLITGFHNQPEIVSQFRGLQAIVPILILSLAHKELFILSLPTQTLILGTLGYIAYWERLMHESTDKYLIK